MSGGRAEVECWRSTHGSRWGTPGETEPLGLNVREQRRIAPHSIIGFECPLRRWRDRRRHRDKVPSPHLKLLLLLLLLLLLCASEFASRHRTQAQPAHGRGQKGPSR